MSAIEVMPLTLPRDALRLVRFCWTVYGDDPHWVPPLLFERKTFLDPARNPFFQHAEVQCFVATRGGRDVGTISAQIDRYYDEVEPNVGFFGFFEFIDDERVAGALLEAACAWLAERGRTTARGPCNFTTNHESGLLVDGFDSDPLVLMTFNRPYYPRIYDALGLRKAQDLYAYWLDQGPVPERIARIATRCEERTRGLTIRPIDKGRWRQELALAKEIYNDAWEDNWGFVKLDDAEFEAVAEGLKPMLDPRLSWLAEIDGEPAAFAVCLPDYNRVVKPMNGRVFPIGWYHWLTKPSQIDQLRVFLLGVKRKFQKVPLGAPLYVRIWESGQQMGVRGAEASWILEDNTRMRGALEKLGAKIYKTYRIYEFPLTPR